MYARAIRLLEEHLDRALLPQWPDYRPTQDLLAALRGDPGRVRGLLEAWAAQTREHLKLP